MNSLLDGDVSIPSFGTVRMGMTATGLYHVGGREYDSRLGSERDGRFISPFGL